VDKHQGQLWKVASDLFEVGARVADTSDPMP